ncbi:hypothetical protein [Desulfoluna spongiiphila]|uniref:hypothetical protein n=1 Tax=Desulfoluna spongiiphila TaxID=419481 RepID=UPI001255D8E1|nr:hypothetical protein [Desulfoluna spongiiphila]VVS91430.1 hypothetical protein DBB_9980 [Desulfoluna spongiiphila]
MSQRKITIDWSLNCSQHEALEIMSQSIENIFLPWFASQSNMKGLISDNTFHIWPNTLYSGITDIGITGEIVPVNNCCQLVAYSRIIPPFRYFKQNSKLNWTICLIMVASWVTTVFAMVTGKSTLSQYSMYVFFPSTLYGLIQFTKYIQEPELVDLEKRLKAIFSNYIE